MKLKNEKFFYNPNPKLYIGCDPSWGTISYTEQFFYNPNGIHKFCWRYKKNDYQYMKGIVYAKSDKEAILRIGQFTNKKGEVYE